MERFPKRIFTLFDPRTVSRPTPAPSVRQPVPGKLRHLPPLQVPRLGHQKWYQILRRLSALQAWSDLFARRVSPLLPLPSHSVTGGKKRHTDVRCP